MKTVPAAARFIPLVALGVYCLRTRGTAELLPLANEVSFFDVALSLPLVLGLGWLAPGVSLACLWSARTKREIGTHFLAVAFVLGTAFIVGFGLLHSALYGHAPGRVAWLVVLVACAALGAVFARAGDSLGAFRESLVLLGATLALGFLLWPKLAHESLNGDGTEAYELARSLSSHPLPYWDLERPEGEGRFGTPVVNPFPTNAFLSHSRMTLVGFGELAPRASALTSWLLAIVFAVQSSFSRVPATPSARAYVLAVAVLQGIWALVFVGYDPVVADMAELAATDLLATVLFLAGVLLIRSGEERLAVVSFLLGAGVLYASTIWALGFLMAWTLITRKRGPALLWCASFTIAVVGGVWWGAHTGDLADWVRQIRSEYAGDFFGSGDRARKSPFVFLLVAATGGLPLVALVRWRRLDPALRALLAVLVFYVLLVFSGARINLHYLTPLPFFFLAPALAVASARELKVATAVVVLTTALCWPSGYRIHREAQELGRITWLDGVGVEEASLAGDLIYDAFATPGTTKRFEIGKHTFVRYASDLGQPGAMFRLGRGESPGYLTIATRGSVTLGVKDLSVWKSWRKRSQERPSSLLLPQILRAHE